MRMPPPIQHGVLYQRSDYCVAVALISMSQKLGEHLCMLLYTILLMYYKLIGIDRNGKFFIIYIML